MKRKRYDYKEGYKSITFPSHLHRVIEPSERTGSTSWWEQRHQKCQRSAHHWSGVGEDNGGSRCNVKPTRSTLGDISCRKSYERTRHRSSRGTPSIAWQQSQNAHPAGSTCACVRVRACACVRACVWIRVSAPSDERSSISAIIITILNSCSD